MVYCMGPTFEIFSNPIIIRPLKQLCAHRCLSEWAVTTQQPLVNFTREYHEG